MKTHANSNINCCSSSWSRCDGVDGGGSCGIQSTEPYFAKTV